VGPKKNHLRKTKEKARARLGNSGTRDAGGLPDMHDQWRARIGGWVRSGGRFWLPQWGPKPGETGCFAPIG
jgi:hypothetical protein